MLLPPPPLNCPEEGPSLPTLGKPHLCTAIFLLLLVAVMLLANIPGQVILAPDIYSDGKYGPHFEGMVETCHHGWPCTFLVRESVVVGTPPSLRLSLWNLAEGVVSLDWTRLAVDLCISLLVLFTAGVMFEYWRRRHRHLLQFHLIDIMAAVLLVGCGLSYWAANEQCRNDQEKSVKQIRQESNAEGCWGPPTCEPGGPTWARRIFGGRPFAPFDRVIAIDIEVDGATIPRLSSLHTLKVLGVWGNVTNQQLDALRDFPQLEALDLYSVGPASEGSDDEPDAHQRYLRMPRLPHLRGLNLYEAAFRGDGLEQLTGIEVLELSYTDITDEGMTKLADLRNLKILHLGGTKVTDAGLQHLSRLQKLETLRLGGTEISDTGLKYLRTLKNLSSLDLYKTAVTDTGLEDLAGLPRVQSLYLSGTRATADGIRKLRRALPHCQIEWSPSQ